MSVNYIEPKSPDLLIAQYGEGSAAPAKLAHINYLQDQLANAAPYTIIGAQLNHDLGVAATISMVSSNCDGCSPGCCPCDRGRNGTCFTISNFATGKYRITLSNAPAKGFNVLITPLADARQNLGIEITSPTEVIVSTYDIVGAAYIDNALKNTYIQFLLWN